MTAEMVAQVRRFNRTVTQRIGVLNENFLASDRSLGQNRLLWEVGVDGRDIRSLLERPGSRLRIPQPVAADAGERRADRRRTEPRRRPGPNRPADRGGPREVAALDQRSDAAAAAILQPLNAGQRDRLVTAMAEVDRLLTASTVEVRECDPREPQARFCLDTSFTELAERFDGGFDPTKKPFRDEG